MKNPSTIAVKNIRKNRLANGLCIDCARPTNTKKSRCKKCSNKKSKFDKSDRIKLRKKQICLSCRKQRIDLIDSPFCISCREKKRLKQVNRRKQFELSNVCRSCGRNPPSGTSSTCESCILKITASRQLGNYKLWQELKKLLESQNYKCPYTGIELKIGLNASLDHIIPKSVGGGNDVDNVQWVHIWANLMKKDLPSDTFKEKLKEFTENTLNFLQKTSS